MEAAHRSGMSVGQWLNQVLAGNLDDEDIDPEPLPSRPRRAARGKPRRIDALNERLERLGQQRMMTAPSRYSDQDNDNSPVLDLIENAVQAIERLEKRAATGDDRTMPGPSRGGLPNEQPTETLHLAEALKAFERRLDSLTPSRAASVDAGVDQRLQGIMAMLDRLQPKTGGERGLAQESPSGFAPQTRGFPDEDPAFSRALSEIEARRRDLEGETGAGSPAAAPTAVHPDIEGMRQQLGLLIARIDDMRVEPKPDANHLQDRLAELTSRIEEWRARPQDDVALLRSDLAGIAASVEKLSPQRLVGMVEDAVATTVEKAWRAQRDGLPERLFEPLERMHEDVRAVLREVAASRGTDRLTQEVGNIARRLDLISQGADPARLDDIARETEAIKALVSQAMRAQPLEGLAHQIEALGRQIEKFQRTPGDDRQVLDAIRDVGDRLERIDPKATFAGIETRLAAIGGIEDKLAEIARGMKKLAKDSQPLAGLDTIAERLERIDRVLESSKGKPLAGLDVLAERLEKIGTSLDRAEQAPPAGDQAALVGMLERLTERMDQIQTAGTDSTALDALQDEISRLAKRMEQVGNTPVGLDGIERSVGDIFTQLDLARRDMREMADTAAKQAAHEAVRLAPRDETSDTLAAEGLLLIKRDLNEFKTAQSDAERRTRSTLEALHGTLETLVARLGDLDSREKSKPAAQPAPDVPAPQAARIAPSVETPATISAQRNTPPVQAAPSALETTVRATKAAPVLDDTLADLPLEPGMQPGQGASAGQAVPGADPRTNFIAAARRAAQVAADRSQAALAEDKPSKGGKPARAPVDPAGAATTFIVRARKPILLGLAAVVFSLGAMKVLTNRNQPGSEAFAPALPERSPAAKPKTPPTAPATSGGPETSEPSADGPESTGTSGASVAPVDNQPMPGAFPNASGKRGQRLSDTNAVTQSDPLTVGSIAADGTVRPLETGRNAITELVAATNLRGQDKLRDAALAGNAAAHFEIGTRYADGRGVTRDPLLAARWFEQAAAGGHGPSQYRLASLYREGKGLTKDSALAFQWFDRAAAQGHVLAMHNAAVLLAEGVHGAPDYAGAALWFKRAAEHGIKDSQFNVAILFARGLGVNQDLGESYRWFAIAALQGDPDAAKKRDDIAARLTKDQLAREVERVKAFKPNKPNPVANEPGVWDRPVKQGT